MSNPPLDFLKKFVLEDEDNDFNLIKLCLQNSLDPIINKLILLNKNGSVRKRNRTDYSRSRKLSKSLDPWLQVKWLQMISDNSVNR